MHSSIVTENKEPRMKKSPKLDLFQVIEEIPFRKIGKNYQSKPNKQQTGP